MALGERAGEATVLRFLPSTGGPAHMKSSEIPSTKMQRVKNEIGYSYVTIKTTRSRINKGLVAIPVSLLDRFPKEKRKITVFFDDEEKPSMKSFVPYTSSSQECRINGLSGWFVKNKFSTGHFCEVFLK